MWRRQSYGAFSKASSRHKEELHFEKKEAKTRIGKMHLLAEQYKCPKYCLTLRSSKVSFYIKWLERIPPKRKVYGPSPTRCLD